MRIDLDPAAGGERWADYTGGSGTEMLKFEYTVLDGDFSGNGVAVLQDTLALNGGTIRSASAITVENARLGHDGLDHDPLHKVVTPATQPPVLLSADASGATLTLTFSEPLGAAASLDNSAFTVKKTPQGGAEETVTLSGSPAISGDTVTLSLTAALLDTDTGVMVSYEKPASGANNKLIDVAGNETASFSDEPVTSTADTTQPRLLRGEIDGDTITLFFSEPLDETTGGKGDYYRINLQWASLLGGAERHGRCRTNPAWWTFTTKPREVYIQGNTVVVVGLKKDNPAFRAGVSQNINNLDYWANTGKPADQRLRDLSGNHVYTPNYEWGKRWSAHLPIVPSTTKLPYPKYATVDRNRLVLTFSAPMDGRLQAAGQRLHGEGGRQRGEPGRLQSRGHLRQHRHADPGLQRGSGRKRDGELRQALRRSAPERDLRGRAQLLRHVRDRGEPDRSGARSVRRGGGVGRGR